MLRLNVWMLHWELGMLVLELWTMDVTPRVTETLMKVTSK
jgi:hypothetical protein